MTSFFFFKGQFHAKKITLNVKVSTEFFSLKRPHHILTPGILA